MLPRRCVRPAIVKAAEFGAPLVRLGTGQHVVLQGGTVITVLPKDAGHRQLMYHRGQGVE